MIRATRPEDIPRLVELANDTGVFKAVEIVTLEEVLRDYVLKPRGDGYHCYTYVQDSSVAGFSCHGPNTMTDRTWDLYWIAVTKDAQRQGIGKQLLTFVEDDIRRQNGRLLMVETSSLASYEATRRFYLKHGYVQAAIVPDFYADGDSMVLFCKRLVGG